jgi:RNA polymerase sigma-70 factor (ECF subfamily)
MPTDSQPLPTSQDSAEARFLDYVRSGDKKLLQTLIQEFSDRSYNQACRIMGRAQDAEDVVQESLLLLVKTAKRYDGSVPFAAWLGRLVTSTALNHRARIHREKRFSREQEAAAMNEHAIASGNAERPELEAVRVALDALPERYRIPLTMHYVSGLSQSETAQALGCPPVTIRQQLARGLERLRDKLGRAGFAVTSAGLLTVFANLPTYAAPPAFKASLAAAASERLIAAAHHVSHRLVSAKKFSLLATGSGFFTASAVAVLAVVATMTLFKRSDEAPIQAASQTAAIDLERGLLGHWTDS